MEEIYICRGDAVGGGEYDSVDADRAEEPGITFGHGGSNNPGWECFLMGYADLHPRGKKECDQKVLKDCGVCSVTNSAAGFTLCAKIFHAVS